MRLPGTRGFALVGAHRNFRLLWIGQFTSGLGSSMTFLAVPLLAVAATGSAVQAGLLGTLSFLTTWLVAIPTGMLADRCEARRLMLACDAVRLGAVAVLAAAAIAGSTPLWLLAAVVVVDGAAAMAFNPAATKLLRAVVPDGALPEAVSANQARGYAAGLAGPPLGGLLFHAGRSLPFLADVASYLVSLWCVWRLPAGPAPEPTGGRRSLLSGVGTGFAVLWRTPFLRATAGYSVGANVAVSMLLFVLLLRPGAAVGPATTGVVLSLATVGGLLGSLCAPAAHRRLGLRPLLLVVALSRLVVASVAAFLGGPVWLGAALFLVLFLGPVAGAAITTTQLRVVPDGVYGRTSGTMSFLSGTLQPLAPFAAGALIQLSGPGAALVPVAVLFGLGAVTVALARGLAVAPAGVPAPVA
ncbi:MFS transporter [Longispora sp. NPDC051575]|uniref:MFS transporter n=1 Tax=Longispora sp. NPDC051575 TaxID=3154943 RepID=UPI003427A769